MPESFCTHRNASSDEFLETWLILGPEEFFKESAGSPSPQVQLQSFLIRSLSNHNSRHVSGALYCRFLLRRRKIWGHAHQAVPQ